MTVLLHAPKRQAIRILNHKILPFNYLRSFSGISSGAFVSC